MVLRRRHRQQTSRHSPRRYMAITGAAAGAIGGDHIAIGAAASGTATAVQVSASVSATTTALTCIGDRRSGPIAAITVADVSRAGGIAVAISSGIACPDSLPVLPGSCAAIAAASSATGNCASSAATRSVNSGASGAISPQPSRRRASAGGRRRSAGCPRDWPRTRCLRRWSRRPAPQLNRRSVLHAPREAAIDDEIRTCDEACTRAGKKRHDVGDFLGLAETAER